MNFKIIKWVLIPIFLSVFIMAVGCNKDSKLSKEFLPKALTTSFLNLNGVMWYYNTWFGNKYSDIKNDLTNLQDNGINIIAFFCPYNGDKTKYDGCDPLDWYNVPPQCGTIQDWKDMVDAAHSKGMKVICYFVNIYIDSKSDFFRTAEKQFAAGNKTANECATFHWTMNKNDPFPSNGTFGAGQQERI